MIYFLTGQLKNQTSPCVVYSNFLYSSSSSTVSSPTWLRILAPPPGDVTPGGGWGGVQQHQQHKATGYFRTISLFFIRLTAAARNIHVSLNDAQELGPSRGQRRALLPEEVWNADRCNRLISFDASEESVLSSLWGRIRGRGFLDRNRAMSWPTGRVPDEAGAVPRRRQEAEGGRQAAAAGLGRGR